MKIFNIIFIVLFFISAVLQYNDPDPYLWIPIYLFAAYLCFEAFKKKYNPSLYYIALLIYGLYAVRLFFDKTGVIHWLKRHHAESLVQNMQAQKPWIRETREFFRLIITIAILSANMLWLGKRKKKKKKRKPAIL